MRRTLVTALTPLTRLMRLMALASLGAVTLTGCVSTTSSADGRSPAPAPMSAPVTPSEASANAMVLIANPPLDTNGNHWRDRIDVTIYLFAQPYPAPVYRNGEMEFSIYPLGESGSPGQPGKPLRTWVLSAQDLERLRSVALPGPCYLIGLSLLANGGNDVLSIDSVDLAACFRTNGAEPVWTQGVTTIQLGAMPGAQGQNRPRPSS